MNWSAISFIDVHVRPAGAANMIVAAMRTNELDTSNKGLRFVYMTGLGATDACL